MTSPVSRPVPYRDMKLIRFMDESDLLEKLKAFNHSSTRLFAVCEKVFQNIKNDYTFAAGDSETTDPQITNILLRHGQSLFTKRCYNMQKVNILEVAVEIKTVRALAHLHSIVCAYSTQFLLQ